MRKTAAIIAVLVLISVFGCFSVSADGIRNYHVSNSDYSNIGRIWSNGGVSNVNLYNITDNNREFSINLDRMPSDHHMKLELPIHASFFVSAGTTVSFPVRNFGGWWGGRTNTLISLSWKVTNAENINEFYVIGTQTINAKGQQNWTLTFPKIEWTPDTDIKVGTISLYWELDMYERFNFSCNTPSFDILIGNTGAYEYEREQATQGGTGAVGDVNSAIPAAPAGLGEAFGGLITAASTNSTQALFPIPSVSIPAVAGMPEIELLDGLNYDMAAWFDKIPPNILTLVRSLNTVALVLFCVREVYRLIEQWLMGRGDNNG